MSRENNNDYVQKCSMKETDCFAREDDGICSALDDTDFGGRTCPFYKPAEQRARELEGKVQYLKGIGREDLIEKYMLDDETGTDANEGGQG